MKKLSWKKFMTLTMMGILLCSLAACGYSSDFAPQETQSVYSVSDSVGWGSDSKVTNESYEMVAEESMDMNDAPTEGSDRGTDVTTNRKLIRTVSMEVETDEFEVMIINVEDRVDAMGGYIEQAYTYNGSAYYNSNRR